MFFIDIAWMKRVDWKMLEWANSRQPVKLEICTGMGSWIIDRYLNELEYNDAL